MDLQKLDTLAAAQSYYRAENLPEAAKEYYNARLNAHGRGEFAEVPELPAPYAAGLYFKCREYEARLVVEYYSVLVGSDNMMLELVEEKGLYGFRPVPGGEYFSDYRLLGSQLMPYLDAPPRIGKKSVTKRKIEKWFTAMQEYLASVAQAAQNVRVANEAATKQAEAFVSELPGAGVLLDSYGRPHRVYVDGLFTFEFNYTKGQPLDIRTRFTGSAEDAAKMVNLLMKC